MPPASDSSTSSRPATLQSLCSSSSALQVPSPERVRALYAFTSKQKLTNPAGYEKNYRWWVGVVEEALREGLLGSQDGLDRLVVSGDEEDLVRKLEWADERSGTKLRPKGIGGVLVCRRRRFLTPRFPLNITSFRHHSLKQSHLYCIHYQRIFQQQHRSGKPHLWRHDSLLVRSGGL